MLRKALLLCSLTACMSGAFVASATPAMAAEDHFCGVLVYPAGHCSDGTYISDWDRVRARYPGPQAHNVWACVGLFNHNSNSWDSDGYICGHTWETNYVGHHFDDHAVSAYRPYNIMPGGACCAHTLIGWTSTT